MPRKSPPQRQQNQVVRVTPDRIRDLLGKNEDGIKRALPEYIKAPTFIRIALTEVQRNPGLLNCSPRSLIGALFQAAQLGLTVDSTLGHAYLVPYKDVCTLIPGYKGLIQLAFNSGAVDSIHAQVVRERDEFDWQEGTEARVYHKPKLLEKVPKDELDGVIAAYCVSKSRTGQSSFTLMSRAEVEARRARSMAFTKRNSGPWVTDPVAMFRKTPTRDHCKWLPAATEKLSIAVSLDERAEVGLSQGLDHLAPPDVFDIEPEDKLAALASALPDVEPDVEEEVE